MEIKERKDEEMRRIRRNVRNPRARKDGIMRNKLNKKKEKRWGGNRRKEGVQCSEVEQNCNLTRP